MAAVALRPVEVAPPSGLREQASEAAGIVARAVETGSPDEAVREVEQASDGRHDELSDAGCGDSC